MRRKEKKEKKTCTERDNKVLPCINKIQSIITCAERKKKQPCAQRDNKLLPCINKI